MITISEWEQHYHEHTLIDVRTPAEFYKGHIPGAVNMPLFSNSERAEVGKLYKQVSKERAFEWGIELVGPKMADFLREAKKLSPHRKLVVHCWRGGQRSQSMAWLFRQAGMEVETLEGGYKAYRNHVLDFFREQDFNLVVLGGRTGSGKTYILHAIEQQGQQVVDLEGLANHKGSSFGAIGEASQPQVEQFEHLLYNRFRELDLDKPIWLENESRSIGRVYIPLELWKKIKASPLINLEIPLEERIQLLVDMYTNTDISELQMAFERIKKRLGGQHLKAAMEALDKRDFATAATIALRYYDKSYQYMLDKNTAPKILHFKTDRHEPGSTARQLIELAQKEIFINSQ